MQLLFIGMLLLFYQTHMELRTAKAAAQKSQTEAAQSKEQLQQLVAGLEQMAAELGVTEPLNAAGQVQEHGYKDGTYQGSGTGFGGTIQVETTISSGGISKVEITSADGEDAAYLDMAKKVIDTVIAEQTAAVDTVSGATFSSGGILEAVRQSLQEAQQNE